MLKFSPYLSHAFLFPSFTISTDVIHAVFSPFITHCACVKWNPKMKRHSAPILCRTFFDLSTSGDIWKLVWLSREKFLKSSTYKANDEKEKILLKRQRFLDFLTKLSLIAVLKYSLPKSSKDPFLKNAAISTP